MGRPRLNTRMQALIFKACKHMYEITLEDSGARKPA